MDQTPRRVALVGTAPSSVHAPFGDESWQIWGVGLRAKHVTRADRWFELHRLAGEPAAWAAEWRRLMREWTHECEIWMFYPEHDLGPKIVAMDASALKDKYGTFFMTSSFSWMMAQAIEEGFEEIGLWGVDMEYGTEYRQQRVGLRHFIEVARLKGIKITRVASSGIALEPIPYPFWMDDPLLQKAALRKKAFTENRLNAKSVSEDMEAQALRFEGARQELAILAKSPPQDIVEYAGQRRDALERQIDAIRRGAISARDDLLKIDGALAELNWLEDYLSP